MRATRELLAFLRPYRFWATLAPLLMLLEVAIDLLQPRLIARIIDSGIAPRIWRQVRYGCDRRTVFVIDAFSVVDAVSLGA